MSTARFSNNILKAARKLQDPRTLVTDNGSRFTSAVMVDYENRAIMEFLRDKYKELGVEFAKTIPEYVKTSSPIPISSGKITRPTDCWVLLDVLASDNSKEYDSIGDRKVSDVLTGRDGLFLPDSSNPLFYEEGNYIYILPSTVTGNIILRYIKKHTDIVISSGASGDGNYSPLIGSFTLADKSITITMNTPFTSDDIGKRTLFRDTTTVYDGTIVGFVAADEVIVDSDNLPSGDIAVQLMLVSDLSPDITDIQFDESFDAEIVDRMVDLANKDTVRNASA